MLAKRFFAATVLVDQDWIHDPSLTVGRALAEHDAEIVAFALYNVGR
jgi:translation elongation factor EF-Ts